MAQRQLPRSQIGTLGEKAVHLALKYYFSPDAQYHEVPVGRFIADIRSPEGIFEIQTRALHRLRQKLPEFLREAPVTVVHPVIENKQLIRIASDGTFLSQRKSPKHETVYSAMKNIYTLREYIENDQFTIALCMLDICEYSVEMPNGKRCRQDKIPVSLNRILCLNTPADYLNLLPENLPEQFTAAQLAEHLQNDIVSTRYFLTILSKIDVIKETGKCGRMKLWQINHGI